MYFCKHLFIFEGVHASMLYILKVSIYGTYGSLSNICNACMPENTIHTKIPTNTNDDVANKWCVGDKYVLMHSLMLRCPTVDGGPC